MQRTYVAIAREGVLKGKPVTAGQDWLAVIKFLEGRAVEAESFDLHVFSPKGGWREVRIIEVHPEWKE